MLPAVVYCFTLRITLRTDIIIIRLRRALRDTCMILTYNSIISMLYIWPRVGGECQCETKNMKLMNLRNRQDKRKDD